MGIKLSLLSLAKLLLCELGRKYRRGPGVKTFPNPPGVLVPFL